MNAVEMVRTCKALQHPEEGVPPEVYDAGLTQREETTTIPSTHLAPEREERTIIPEGQSPFEIADRERQHGMSVTQEEAGGWV